MTARTYVIAEAGVNHDGSLDVARRLVEVAAAAGADAVKFQTFRAGQIVAPGAPQAEYQSLGTGGGETAQEMLRRLELGPEAHLALAEHARAAGVTLLATPFDVDSLRFLANELGVPRLKIASGDLTYGALLLAAARTGLPLVLSTGMADLADVRAALDVVAYGLLQPTGTPRSWAELRWAAGTPEGRAALADRIVLLHCTTAYPTPPEDVNLLAMDTLAEAFGLPVGYSDHTMGVVAALAAVARGAVVVEKHVTLDRGRPGPDHAASLEPDELAAMIANIREVERLLGSPNKVPAASELPNISAARRSLIASRAIAAGERFTGENLDARRPAGGWSPLRVWDLLGRRASAAYAAGELIAE